MSGWRKSGSELTFQTKFPSNSSWTVGGFLQALLVAAMWWTDRSMTQVDSPLLPGSPQKLQQTGMTCEPHEDLFFGTWHCTCKHLTKCSFFCGETQSSTLILQVTQVIIAEIALVLVKQIWYPGLLEFAHVTIAHQKSTFIWDATKNGSLISNLLHQSSGSQVSSQVSKYEKALCQPFFNCSLSAMLWYSERTYKQS